MFREDRQKVPTVGVSTVMLDGSLDLSKVIFVSKVRCILLYVVARCVEDWGGVYPLSVGTFGSKGLYVVNADIPKHSYDVVGLKSVGSIVEAGTEVSVWVNSLVGDSGIPIADGPELSEGKIEFKAVYVNL